MALWKISEGNPFWYTDCTSHPCASGGRIWYGDSFCAGANLYSERFSPSLFGGHFYYLPDKDKYGLICWYDSCWTGSAMPKPWILWVHEIDPDATISAVRTEGVTSGFFTTLINTSIYGIEVGSYGKLYATSGGFAGGQGVYEYTIIPGRWGWVEGSWIYLFSDLTDINLYFPMISFSVPNHSLVNREDGIIMLCNASSPYMHFWDIKSVPSVYMGVMRAPGNLADVSYEDRYRFWVVTQNGYIQKINYHLLRTELLTELPDKDPTDIAYRIAWDQRRFRLALLRYKPDNTNGSPRSTIEFYRPLPKAYLLTDPVPIRPLRYGKHIPFSFHLVGTAGEGISPYMVDAVLEAPIDGRLERGSAGTGQNGIGGVEYVAPNLSCEETLQLQVTITDGD